MKKRKFTSLTLNKKSISNLQTKLLTGGFEEVTTECYSINPFCKTDLCASHAQQTCTITYEECFTELRFCGTEC